MEPWEVDWSEDPPPEARKENFYLLRLDKFTRNNSYMTISLPSQISR